MGWLLIASFFIAAPAYSESANKQKSSKQQPVGTAYADDARVAAFAADVAQRRNLDPDQVTTWLAQARQLPVVQKLMLPPPKAEAKNWAAYRARFIEPVRLKAGAAFWQQNQAWLAKAEADTGVPASLIVGVLGVETLYGQHMGNFRTLDALATLAFDFPAAHPRAAARQAFFRDELEQFLSLCQRQGLDPLSLRSSYAGAMGLPQFMPSSWARHAVDFDGDGRIDLFGQSGSAADAIGSVAQYFKAYGWKPGLPTHVAATVRSTPEQLDTLLAADILPSFSLERLRALGVEPATPEGAPASPWALIELFNGDPAQGGQPPSYVVGSDNFYTVTRYNWSSYYAMAVIELGQAIAQQRRGEAVAPTLARPALH
ncbi:lytic murein transglycosylase [Hydrogenophaga soli]